MWTPASRKEAVLLIPLPAPMTFIFTHDTVWRLSGTPPRGPGSPGDGQNPHLRPDESQTIVKEYLGQ